MRSALLLGLLAACEASVTDAVDDTDDTEAPACAEAPGVVTPLVEEVTRSGTEGLAIGPAGEVWVAGGDALWRLEAGAATRVADAPGAVGAAWWREAVWVALWEDEAGDPSPALLRVSPEGGTTRIAVPTIAKPNFLLPTPWNTLLVSDDFDTRIFEVDDEGAVSVWAEDVPSPNGMGFSPDGGLLWVASTFTDPGLSAIVVEGESAGGREQVHAFEAGTTPDGLAVAGNGDVLVALNLAERIDAWDGQAVRTVATGLPTPASLAYGAAGVDPCAVVVTSLFGPTVSVVSTGVEGPAAP